VKSGRLARASESMDRATRISPQPPLVALFFPIPY
jgi:hypothetical protein